MTNLDKLFTAPKATEKQIRNHYKALGFECRISGEYVRFRPANRSKRDTGAWQDGRWVSDYFVVDNQIVLI